MGCVSLLARSLRLVLRSSLLLARMTSRRSKSVASENFWVGEHSWRSVAPDAASGITVNTASVEFSMHPDPELWSMYSALRMATGSYRTTNIHLLRHAEGTAMAGYMRTSVVLAGKLLVRFRRGGILRLHVFVHFGSDDRPQPTRPWPGGSVR